MISAIENYFLHKEQTHFGHGFSQPDRAVKLDFKIGRENKSLLEFQYVQRAQESSSSSKWFAVMPYSPFISKQIIP
jgi:hypothetical protein